MHDQHHDPPRTTTDLSELAAWFGGEPQPTENGCWRVDMAPPHLRKLTLALHDARDQEAEARAANYRYEADRYVALCRAAEQEQIGDRQAAERHHREAVERQHRAEVACYDAVQLSLRIDTLQHELHHARRQHHEAVSPTAVAAAARVRAPTGSRRRESHGTRPGHRRTATRTASRSGDSGDGPGDGPGSHQPRLALAPRPGAIYTFACLTAEQRGAEVAPI